MCERLLNLQEIYVSSQNICIEVYGNSVGTITPHSVSAGQEIVPNRIGKEVNIFASNWWAMMAS